MATATVPADLPALWARLSSPRGIFLTALVVGLLTVLAMDVTYRGHLLAVDSAEYVQLADSLAAGQGYTLPNGAPGTRVPPLFPLMLAGVRLLPVDVVAATGVVNALLGAVTCVLLCWICRRTFADQRVPPIAALGLAVYPFHLFNTGYVLKENLAISGLVLAVAVWVEAMHRKSFRWALMAGVATGVAVLARYYPTAGLPIAFVIGAGYERWRRAGFPWLRLVAGLLGVLALCVAPWFVRNWVRSGTFSLSTYGIGYYLYTSNGPGVVPDTSGYFEARGLTNDVTYSVGRDQWNEQEALSKALETMADDPQRTATLFGAKLISFWRPVWAGSSAGTWLTLGATYAVMMLLALVGVRARGPGRFRAVLWATIGVYAIVHLIFWGMIRERNYIEPFLMAFAARGFLVVADALQSRRVRSGPRWVPRAASPPQ